MKSTQDVLASIQDSTSVIAKLKENARQTVIKTADEHTTLRNEFTKILQQEQPLQETEIEFKKNKIEDARIAYKEALEALGELNKKYPRNVEPAQPESNPRTPSSFTPWLEKIVEENQNLPEWAALPPSPTSTPQSTLNYTQYFVALSERKTQDAETIRNITLSRKSITVDGQTKTVLYRDSTQALKTLTPEQKSRIAALDYEALWNAHAAGACKFAQDLPEGVLREAFLAKLWTIHQSTDAFNEKATALISLLGGFFEKQSPEEITDRLEAERDMILVDTPCEIVATFYQSPVSDKELSYEIEIPSTELSEEQIKFFSAARDHDLVTLCKYTFYAVLKPWQKAMIKRDASKILEGNRTRPTQMHFLPMAPNFWTKYTVAKTESGPIEIINSINTHGALSARLKGLTDESAKAFQDLQYSQVRNHFRLIETDVFCYTNFMEHVPLKAAPDGSAAKYLRLSRSATNHLYSTPLGGFSRTYRFFHPLTELFYKIPFENDDQDPLLKDVFEFVGNVTSKFCHPLGDPLTIDHFMNLDSKFLSDDIKMDIEQVYRHAMKIHELRNVIFFTDNLRVAALRTTLYHMLVTLEEKLDKEVGPHDAHYKKGGRKSPKISYKADTVSCKSTVDRAKLVALHTSVFQQKERLRRALWKKTDFPASTLPVTPWLQVKSAYFFAMVWLSKVTVPIVSHFLTGLTWVVNGITQLTTGKTLRQHREALTQQIMERRLPAINEALADTTITPESRDALMVEKASLINDYVKAELNIMARTVEAGHTRAMPAETSFSCGGVKKGTLEEVAPILLEHAPHISGVSKVNKMNHGLMKKLKIKDSPDRAWVSGADKEAAKTACSNYNPPPAKNLLLSEINMVSTEVITPDQLPSNRNHSMSAQETANISTIASHTSQGHTVNMTQDNDIIVVDLSAKSDKPSPKAQNSPTLKCNLFCFPNNFLSSRVKDEYSGNQTLKVNEMRKPLLNQ